VDLSAEPRIVTIPVEHKDTRKTVHYSETALAQIKSRLDQLGISPNSFSWRPENTSTASPYPGLGGFEENDAGLFFGRGGDVARGLAYIRRIRRSMTPRVLVVQAASGAGKSSFLRAGIWPRLKRDPDFNPVAILRPATGVITGETGLSRGVAAWFATRKRPGMTARAIQNALLKPEHEAALDLAHFINEAVALAHEVRKITVPEAPPPAPVLAVDQAEELFADADREESSRFLRILSALLSPAGQESRLTAPLIVLLTIRADSVDALLHATTDIGLQAPELFPLPPLGREAYRDIILKPAEVARGAGLRIAIDEDLADALVRDSDGADALPLLAFTLKQLVADYRVGSEAQLTLAQYREFGGVGGALIQRLRAAQKLAGFDDVQGDALKRLFIPMLTTWDDEATPPGAKRLVAREADLFAGERAGLRKLANSLVEQRLLTRSGGGGGAIVEVAHEALLRQPPLAKWLEESEEFLIWRKRLARARAAYEANERGLLIGRELQIARDWVDRAQKDEFAAEDRSFIAASESSESDRQSEERLRLEERERLVREAELASAEREAAREQAIKARDAAVLAQSQYLADLSLQETEEHNNPVNGLLLALEALPDKDSDDLLQRDKTFWPWAEMSLELARRAIRERQVISPDDESLLAVAPNGNYFALSSADGMLRICEIGTLKELCSLNNRSCAQSAMFTTDSTRLVTGATDGTVRLWDLASGRELVTLKGDDNRIQRVEISLDGTRLVTVSGTEQVTIFRIWDVTAQRQVAMLQEGKEGERLGFLTAITPDRSRVITAGKGDTVYVWDMETGRELLAINVRGSVYAVALTPDGKHFVTGGRSNLATLRDLVSGRELMEFRGHTSAVSSLAVTPDGRRLISGSSDGVVRVWDVTSGRELLIMKGHTGLYPLVDNIWVTSDGGRAITQSWDGTTRIWDLAAKGSEPILLAGHSGRVTSNVASSDGRLLITASMDKTARLWEAGTGREIRALTHPETVTKAVFTLDGRCAVSGSTDGVLRVWDLETGGVISARKGHSGAIHTVTITADGSRIVTGGRDATARVWDVRSGREIYILEGHTDEVRTAVVTLDGTLVLTGSDDHTIRAWNLASGKQHRVLAGHINSVLSLAVAPDSRLVVSGSADYTLRVWDIDTGRELHIRVAHSSAVCGVALTPDGKRIVSGSYDGTIRIFELSSGVPLADLKWHGAGLRSMALTPDGMRLLTAAEDGSACVWELFPERGDIGSAKAAAPRCLTPTERKRYHLSPTPPAWCARLKKWPYNRGGAASATVLFDRGDREEAEIIIAAVSAIDPGVRKRFDAACAESQNGRAWSLLMSGAAVQGLAYAEAAAALAPDNPNVLDTRGQIYAALCRWDEAIVDLERAIAGGVAIASSHAARGRVLEARGNRDAAIADYRKALTFPAPDEHAQRAHAAAIERLAALGIDEKFIANK
jgi:WD40 repeat protein